MKRLISRTILGCGAAIGALAIATAALGQQRTFDVPAQPAVRAIPEFARQAGVQIIAPADQLAGVSTQAIQGEIDVRAALARLLDGTGLVVATDDGRTITLRRAAPAPGARSQSALDDQAATEIEEVVVLGTRIRDAAPTSPLITIDRDAIDRGGYATVQEAVARTPQNFGGTTAATPSVTGGNVGFTNQIDIRGLGSEATLTLVNGRRLAGGAGDQGRAVDISIIPLAAVERIDILTDGASALYGSDAIGGVVNLVLKDDFEGAEIAAQEGVNTTGADSSFVSGVVGAQWGSGRLVMAAQYDEREALRYEEVGITTLDFTAMGGGDFRLSTFGSPGTLLPIGFFGGQPFSTITGPGGSPVFFASLPEGDGRNLQVGQLGLNEFNYSEQLPIDVTPRQRNASLFATVEQELGPVTLFADGGVSRRENLLRSFNFFNYIVVPTTNAFSPFAEPVMVGYEFTELGPITFDVENRGWFVNAGVRGDLGFRNWTWEAVGSSSEDRSDSRFDLFDDNELNARLASSDPATAFNPFGDGSAQPAGLADALRQVNGTVSETSLKTLSALAQGEAIDLPGGPLRLAIGAEYRRDDLSAGTEVDGVPAQDLFPSSSRDVQSIYGEAYLPIVGEGNRLPMVAELAISIAARYDDYSDFGSTLNPKVGLRWRPVDGLALKANYGTSFRAPSLRELSLISIVSPNVPFTDPDAPGGPAVVFIDLAQGGNPDLEEEEAETFTLTAELQPDWLPGARFSAGYHHIDYTNRIRGVSDGLTIPVLLQLEDELPPGIVVRDGAGVLQRINITNINSAATVRSGFDLAAGYSWSAGAWGEFDLGASGTFIDRYEDQLIAGTPVLDLKGKIGNPPSWRGRMDVSWSRGAWGANVGINHVNGLVNEENDPAILRRKVDDQTTVDAQLSFATEGPSGFTIRLGATNLFDERPPFVDGLDRRGFDAQNYVIEGRTIYLRVAKSF